MYNETIVGLNKDLASDTDVANKVKELIFAFSTDSGSLSSLDGYVVMIGDENTSYVTEFQNDGANVLGKNSGSLIICATDYGYHFMFKNKMVKDYANLDSYVSEVDAEAMNKAGKTNASDYFDYLMANWADLDDADTETYLYSLANTYMEDILSDYETELERVSNADENKVIRYADRYADLIED